MKKYDIYKGNELKHCLYGLDADLIMLGLVSREKHFTLLREKLIGNSKSFGKKVTNGSLKNNGPASDEFHLLEISLLRDMLFLEFKPRENFGYTYISTRPKCILQPKVR
jgi:5'-3' exoribonuclease 1